MPRTRMRPTPHVRSVDELIYSTSTLSLSLDFLADQTYDSPRS